MKAASFARLATLLNQRSGQVLGQDKMYLVQARLRPIIERAGIADLDGLMDRLHAEPFAKLTSEVVEAMTTNETLFFRDGYAFTDLAERVLPRLVNNRPLGAKLRVWSAAASYGQEAYSVAMLALEQQRVLADKRVEILATDIAEIALQRARLGIYSDFEMQRGLSAARCARHFQRKDGQWQIDEGLRAMVEFRQHNLLAEARDLGRFDVVFCRNVLIYFDSETKRRVLRTIASQLAPDGVLYVGGSETLLGLDVGLRKLDGHGGYGLDAAWVRRGSPVAVA